MNATRREFLTSIIAATAIPACQDEPDEPPKPDPNQPNPALDYLRIREFCAGNGQCPECWGVSERWTGDFRYPCVETTGHEKGCELAEAIVAAGGTVRYADPSKFDPKMSRACMTQDEREMCDEMGEKFKASMTASFDKWLEQETAGEN